MNDQFVKVIFQLPRAYTYLALALAIGSVAAPVASGTILASDFSGTPAVTGSAFNSDVAQQFTMGGASYYLTQIDAILGGFTNSDTSTITARLMDNNATANTPGTNTLVTFTLPPLGGAIAPQAFVPKTTFQLQANAVYWFVIGNIDQGLHLQFVGNNAGSFVGSAATIDGRNASAFTGTSNWNFVDDTEPYYLQVEGTQTLPDSVPEPSSLSFIVLTMVANATIIGKGRTALNARKVALGTEKPIGPKAGGLSPN